MSSSFSSFLEEIFLSFHIKILHYLQALVGMAMKAYHVLRFFLRLAFVLSVWLFIIPFVTFWIWRLTFVRSLGEVQRLFLSHISATSIYLDCMHGFILSASMVFIFLGASSARDYLRGIRELGEQDAKREDEGQDRHGGNGHGEDAGGGQGIAKAGQIIRRNAENVAAHLEAHVEQMSDGLDDDDDDLEEDVPYKELVGIQGPVLHLIENAITVSSSKQCNIYCHCTFRAVFIRTGGPILQILVFLNFLSAVISPAIYGGGPFLSKRSLEHCQ
ncbi:putative E3 ubiquitin ligase SUD1 isoform X3 [Tasmannia lanceolata]|uniref:putative E3 ubiquitin ligase SUD1 isoform X3 n=1 Tax=Tasmannia lanceolata TaxID=3420 RepID=UPI00406443AF